MIAPVGSFPHPQPYYVEASFHLQRQSEVHISFPPALQNTLYLYIQPKLIVVIQTIMV
jgi:hypothetical protein